MPGRFTPAMQKALRAKAYTFQCNALSSDATTIQQTFTVQAGVLRGVRPNGITYPHDAAAIRLNDQNSVAFTDGGGTVPYTAAHSMVGKSFSVSAWIKTPAMCAAEFPIFQVADQYYLSLTATQELEFKVGTAANCIGLTSMGTVPNETWTAVCATWDGTAVKLYIGGTNDEGISADVGAFTALTNGSVASTMGMNTELTYANGAFADLALWNVCLDEYQVATITGSATSQNVQSSPWVISWYTWDHPDDTADACKDAVGGHDMATTGAAISEDAPGGGTGANVVAANHTGRLLCQVVNVGELRTYDHVVGTNFGQAFNVETTWNCGFNSGSEGIFAEDGTEQIDLQTPTMIDAIQLKLSYMGSEISSAGAVVLPIVSHPGHVTVRVTLITEV